MPNSQPSIFDRIFNGPPQLSEPVRQLIGSTPYFGLVYNGGRAINALVKWIQSMHPQGTSNYNSYVPGQPSLSDTGGDPFDPNNPLGYKIDKPGGNTAPGIYGPRYGSAGGMSPGQVYNANRPAFSPTYQQLINPGSAIGPIGTTGAGTGSRPGDSGLLSMPGMFSLSSAARSDIYRKNQL